VSTSDTPSVDCNKSFCSNFGELLNRIFHKYHATMESYSDKFHVDIPNVLLARARCAYCVRMARCLLCAHGAVSTVLSSDCSDRLASLSEKKKQLRITITVIVITL
jgi:hypothetical protein